MPTRILKALAVTAVAALLVAGCGDGGSDDGAQPAGDTAGAADTDGADPASGELPQGVAATVAGEEIPEDDLEVRVGLLRDQPQISEQLGQQGEAGEQQLAAEVLSQLVISEIILAGAADEDLSPTDEEIAAYRQPLEEQAGGADAFVEQARQGGIPEEHLDRELAVLVTLDKLAKRLGAGEGQDQPGTDPIQNPAVQEWIREKIGRFDVVVAAQHGQWDPQSARVMPPGGGLPAPDPTG